jgi:hypothetical protein
MKVNGDKVSNEAATAEDITVTLKLELAHTANPPRSTYPAPPKAKE